MEQGYKFPVRFFLITFCWSWLLWLPLILAGSGILDLEDDLLKVLYVPVTVLAAFGPAMGAIVSLETINGRGASKKFLKTFLDLQFGLKTWLVPTAVLLASTMIAWFVPELFGMKRLSMLLPNVWIFPAYWLFVVFLGGGQEEIGWRGYILAHLEKRFGVIPGSLILSVVWVIWHLPLWLVPGAVQSYMSFGGFMLLTCGYSFSWVST